LLTACSVKKSDHKIISLNNDWEFTSEIYNKSYPASVTGSVHSDLFSNNLIPDPSKEQNENKLQWIDTLEWIYTKEFSKPKNLNHDHQLEIVFHGLDTYADVYLNDSLMLSANNMFVPYKLYIDPNILKNKNNLTVKFKPVLKEEQKQYSQLPYELPGGSRVFTRKAAHHYGWDWGPKYITTGIWQDVELHIWETAKIQNLNYSIGNLDTSIASINFQVEINSLTDFIGDIKINVLNENLNYSFENTQIKKGIHTYNFELEIINPKFWWTHNLGEPFLYKINTSISSKNHIIDTKNINIGIRKIELIQEPDKYGESFYFKLNDTPVFMKGANYIPQSSFPGTVSVNKYKKIIADTKSANMNMLRVWGGGIYEKDVFYDLCDEAGILIWQDFMFANAMYPNDSLFLKNIKTEAEFQVQRLSKHPSLAVWCGNNEIDEAWHNWGWATNYSKEDSAEIWNNYVTIFHKILPEIVVEYSSKVPYTSSSPLFGRGNPQSSFVGDNHYWYVWHDAYDFEWYNKVTGRFMSEFGFQSFPSLEAIEYFDSSENKFIDSEVMLAHQKHHKGNFLINHYMKDYYPIPDKFEDFIYISQLLQAEGIRTGILSQRRAKPFCMGSLYWQLNDCWPAISWSSIDYLGNWKALHYFATQDFKNVIIDPYIHNDSVDIYIVSDSLDKINAQLLITLLNFKGEKLHSEKIQVIIDNSSTLQFSKTIAELLQSNNLNNNFLLIELKADQVTLDSRKIFFTEPKNLLLNKFDIETKIEPIKEGYEILFNSKNLIKNLYIHIPIKGQLSDNYFDLLPNTEKKIIFKTTEKTMDLNDLIQFNSLNHIIKKN